MTMFFVKVLGDTDFRLVDRQRYREVARESHNSHTFPRTGTSWKSGIPVKRLEVRPR